ncbi:hypothetical protein BX661DRAFT_178858 [Kickxella alabastrina]|uniref:uncharacterized protein n=1 Tax=Kickxella alabastrina TaxID=61397 RepID=UPI00221ED017|nr:uncharacterized protein BX661DRAFT_178858 [Kickxella alabastrina]KAI7832955.1 hypothetical protein BX661DRAFT_178858 [Kickxella alabastrina]
MSSENNNNNNTATNGISKEEVALYDRQIRLWGMEAQARLRQSSIRVIGVKALTLEVCKNLVLAGLGSITIQDSTPINEIDFETQYYFHEADLGQPKDVVLAERLRILNPLVNIQTGEGRSEDTTYDLVVKIGTGIGGDSLEVNGKCRKRGERFIAADSFGLFGYIFIDCLDAHEYIEEEKPKDDNATVKRISLTASYKPLADSLTSKPGIANLNRLVRKFPPLVFVCQTLSTTAQLEDIKSAEVLAEAVRRSIEGRGIPDGVVDDILFGRVVQSLGTEFVPCASVVGGTLAQEILKIITRKDMPMNNWYTYDAIKADAITCQL